MKKQLAVLIMLVFTMSSIFAQTLSENCLVAYYPFTANADDESGHGHDGIVNGATLTTDRFGFANQAYYFNGSSAYISISNITDITGYNEYSFCAWINPSSLNTFNTIVSKVSPNRDFNLKIIDDGYIRAEFGIGATYYYCSSDPGIITTGTWNHIAATWDGNMWRLYLNGDYIDSNSTLGEVPPWTGTRMDIGAMNGVELFTGKIDEVRIYNCAIDANEISELVTGIAESDYAQNAVLLYPNPASDNVSIDSENEQIGAVEILDVNGRLVTACDGQQGVVDVSNLCHGIYVFRIFNQKGQLIATKKISKD